MIFFKQKIYVDQKTTVLRKSYKIPQLLVFFSSCVVFLAIFFWTLRWIICVEPQIVEKWYIVLFLDHKLPAYI